MPDALHVRGILVGRAYPFTGSPDDDHARCEHSQRPTEKRGSMMIKRAILFLAVILTSSCASYGVIHNEKETDFSEGKPYSLTA